MTDERVVYICSLSLHLYVLTLLANYTSTERLFSALVYASGHTSFYLTQRAVYALFSFNNSIIIKLFVTHTHDIISDFLLNVLVALKRAVWCCCRRCGKSMSFQIYLEDVYLVTALVPSLTACLASSPGRSRRTAVWISRLVIVERRL